jgi:hypothetical protein
MKSERGGMLASAHGHDNTKNHKLIFIHKSIKQCAPARNKKIYQKLAQEPDDTKNHKTKVIQYEKEMMCISMKKHAPRRHTNPEFYMLFEDAPS